jgi:hypothetical protein
MTFNDDDRLLWAKYETVSIVEGAYLIYGLEPKSFLYEAACGEHQPFFERGADEEIHDISEQVQSAALGGKVEIAHKVLLADGSLNREKTQLYKHSFASWCRLHYPEVATLLSPVIEPDGLATSPADLERQPATEKELELLQKKLKEVSSCIEQVKLCLPYMEKEFDGIPSGKQVQSFIEKLLDPAERKKPRVTKTYSNALSKLNTSSRR